MNNKIYQFYLALLKKHGPPEKIWPQWCARKKAVKDQELIMIGAILTQRTSWHNANLALKNLKRKKLLSLSKIAKLSNLKELTELIRPAGFFQTKPKRLHSLALFISKEYGSLNSFAKEKTAVARKKLLNLYGIGPETADTILLYALNKPSFVIDEYTKRFMANHLSLTSKFDYDNLKKLFEENLPKKVTLYQNYHTLIIIDQKGLKGSLMEKI